MFSFLQNGFMVTALVIGLLVAFIAALLSPFLVLSRQSLIADGLAHVSFTGVVIGILLGSEPFYFAIPFAILAALFITFLSERMKVDNDASIGVVSVFALALGLIIIKKSGAGFNRTVDSFLIGNILTVENPTLVIIFSAVFALLLLLFIIFFYRKLLINTYDETYAKFIKSNSRFLRYIISALTAVFVVIGVRAIGALLISAFIIFPTLIARQFTKSFFQTLLFGLLSALLAVFIGVFASYHLDIQTGPSIIMVFSLFLALSYVTGRFILKRG